MRHLRHFFSILGDKRKLWTNHAAALSGISTVYQPCRLAQAEGRHWWLRLRLSVQHHQFRRYKLYYAVRCSCVCLFQLYPSLYLSNGQCKHLPPEHWPNRVQCSYLLLEHRPHSSDATDNLDAWSYPKISEQPEQIGEYLFNHSVCPSTDVSFGRSPGTFHCKGCVIRHLVSHQNTVDDMLAEADRRARVTDTGIAVNHTDQWVI